VATSSYRGEVEERVLLALFGVKGIRPKPVFFSPDNFTFGTPLELSQLEAVIQEAPASKRSREFDSPPRLVYWREFRATLTVEPTRHER
jgi:hypothetical protein